MSLKDKSSQGGILIIYSALRLGGIETFFVRLAKERFSKGLNTYLLLLDINKSNQELLIEAKKYAEVINVIDLLKGPFIKLSKILPISLLLMMGFPLLSQKKSKLIFEKSTIIHVFKPLNAHFVFRILKKFRLEKPITIGFYHTDPFIYKTEKKYAYFEEKSFDLVINQLPKNNLIIFNDKLLSLFKENYSIDYYGASIFPLGVIDEAKLSKGDLEKSISLANDKDVLKICSIGRIFDFKTYNSWMLDVVKELSNNGLNIQYDIYGEGPLKSKLQQKLIDENIKNVRFCGEIPYSKFGVTLQKYDLFVGSGTAIIEASANGIPSIIGIEYTKEPETYGFFSELDGFSYNEKGLHPTVSVSNLIKRFVEYTSEQLMELKNNHIEKASLFTIEQCSKNIEELEKNATPVEIDNIEYNSIHFISSYLYNGISKRLGNH